MYLHNYITEEYESYKYGNPYRAAINLVNKITDIEKIFIDCQEDFELAGEFIAPAMKEAFKNNLQQLIEEVLENNFARKKSETKNAYFCKDCKANLKTGEMIQMLATKFKDNKPIKEIFVLYCPNCSSENIEKIN